VVGKAALSRLSYMHGSSFDLHIPFVEHLGMQLLELGGGVARVGFEPKPEHTNSWKAIHGGVLLSLLDVAMSSAARSLDPACNGCTTVEIKANFLAAAFGPVIVESRAQRAGRSLIYSEGEIRDRTGGVLAKGSGTFKLLYPNRNNE
jgi:uncharacterized protein (TIGR00369 family)